MKQVTTNIRLPQDEYQELKRLALTEGKSLASMVREATQEYKVNKLRSPKSRQALFNLIVKSSVKIDIPVTELIHQV